MGTWPYPFFYGLSLFMLQIEETDSSWPAEPKIFTIQPFPQSLQTLLYRNIIITLLSISFNLVRFMLAGMP